MASDPIFRARVKRDARKQTPTPSLALVPDPVEASNPPAEAPSGDGHAPVLPLSADLSADILPPDTAKALAALVLEYDRVGTRIASLKSSQDELKSEIESICFEIPAKRISGPGWHTTRSKKPTTRTDPDRLRENKVEAETIAYAATNCDKNKLAEKGVDPDTIAYATITTWSKEFVLPVVEHEKAEK